MEVNLTKADNSPMSLQVMNIYKILNYIQKEVDTYKLLEYELIHRYQVEGKIGINSFAIPHYTV